MIIKATYEHINKSLLLIGMFISHENLFQMCVYIGIDFWSGLQPMKGRQLYRNKTIAHSKDDLFSIGYLHTLPVFIFLIPHSTTFAQEVYMMKRRVIKEPFGSFFYTCNRTENWIQHGWLNSIPISSNYNFLLINVII